jgi:exodeoxyribonuclease-3
LLLRLDALIKPRQGQVQVLDYNNFFFGNVDTPNPGAELIRLKFRCEIWDPAFCLFLKSLRVQRPVTVCGDFNVAHREIDLAHPDQNHQSAGLTDEEREGFSCYIKPTTRRGGTAEWPHADGM